MRILIPYRPSVTLGVSVGPVVGRKALAPFMDAMLENADCSLRSIVMRATDVGRIWKSTGFADGLGKMTNLSSGDKVVSKCVCVRIFWKSVCAASAAWILRRY